MNFFGTVVLFVGPTAQLAFGGHFYAGNDLDNLVTSPGF